jgi:hypothetical protein
MLRRVLLALVFAIAALTALPGFVGSWSAQAGNWGCIQEMNNCW